MRQGLHLDGRLTPDRAVVFANAAPDAQIAQDIGPEYRCGLACFCGYLDFFQNNGFFGQRAHFLANAAQRVISPWQAAVGVYGRQSDRCFLFCLFAYRGDRARRAGSDAGVAVIAAVP